jgi:tetratricopeptide (TPR) repeat protein
MVKKAVELRPNDGYIIDSLGWAYYQLGDYEQAVINIERAVELLPADPTIADHLGDAYWRVGRKLEAKFQWQHAIDNKPEPEDLKRIQEKMEKGLPDIPPVKPAQSTTGQSNG